MPWDLNKLTNLSTLKGMVDSIQNIGLRGMQAGLASAAESATNISTDFQPNSTGDPVADIVGLQQSVRQVKANAKVIKAANELDQNILDILA